MRWLDRHVPPARVLRGLALASSILMASISTALKYKCNEWLVLALIQVFYLTYSPMFSITTALVLARLQDAKKEFGPIRSLATFGWMAGALLISAVSLDRSAYAGYVGALVWLLVAMFTYFPARPSNSGNRRSTCPGTNGWASMRSPF